MSNKDDEKSRGLPDHNLSPLAKLGERDTTSASNSVSEETAPATNNDPRTAHGFKWVLVCFSLYVSALIYGLDTTIAADIQSPVVKSLGHVDQLTWLGTGFQLGSLCSVLPAATFYSIFDMKYMFWASIALFEAGSALCGAAPSMNALIVGRVIAGIGGSGIFIGVLNYFSLCTSHKERGAYVSGIGFCWGIGAILGPVIGGAFSDSSATWRWSFYINLVVAAVCAPICLIYLPSLKSTSHQSTVISELTKFDWAGVILSTAVMSNFTVVFTFAGPIWVWNDARTIAMIVVLGALIAMLVAQQSLYFLTTPEKRLFPPGRLLRDRSQILLGIETACAISNLFLPLYYMPNYFQFVNHDTALMAAVRLLPFVLISIATNLISGILLPKISLYAMLYLASGIFMTIGSSLMFTVRSTTPTADVYGYSIFLAIGSGLVFNCGYSIAGIKVSGVGHPPTDVQSVISLQNLWQIGGSLVSLVISGQIFQSYAFRNLKQVLQGEGLSDSQIHAAVSGTQSTVLKNLSPELTKKAVEAITMAISKVYILGMVLGVLALLGSLLLKWERLFGLAPSAGAE